MSGDVCGPGQVDLCILQGDSFEIRLLFKGDNGVEVDITGWTLLSQVRAGYQNESPVVVDFTVTIVDPLLGEATLSLTAAETQVLPIGSSLRWDVLSEGLTGVFVTFAGGSVEVLPTVTSESTP